VQQNITRIIPYAVYFRSIFTSLNTAQYDPRAHFIKQNFVYNSLIKLLLALHTSIYIPNVGCLNEKCMS
jgi:hypothetical protein